MPITEILPEPHSNMVAALKHKTGGWIRNLSISYTNSFLSFLVFLLLARQLGALEYALVAIGIAIGGFIVPLMDLGSSRTFIRDAVLAKDSAEIEQMVLASFGMRLLVATLLVLPLFVFSLFYTNDLERAISVLMIALWMGLLGLYPTSWFDYLHETARQNLFAMGERIASLGLVVGFMLVPTYGHATVILAFVLFLTRAASIVVQVGAWWKNNARSRFRLQWRWPRKRISGVSLYFTVALIFNAFFVYGNQLILGKYADAAELSAYSMAFQLVSLVLLFQSMVIRLFNRSISEVCRSQGGIIRHVLYHGTLLAGISALLALAVWIVSGYGPALLSDSRFDQMIDFMPLLCTWIVIVGGGQVVTQYLLETKQERFYLGTSIVGGILAILLGALFVPRLGAYAVSSILIAIHVCTISVGLMRLIYLGPVRLNAEDSRL